VQHFFKWPKFDVCIGRSIEEAYREMWNLGTNSEFPLGPTIYKENLINSTGRRNIGMHNDF
jgi:hypothetical protein